MNDLLMRRREEDLNFDLKYVLFNAQFNCFSRDSIKVALFVVKILLSNLNVIKQDNEARQLVIMSAVVVQLYLYFNSLCHFFENCFDLSMKR